MAIIQAMTTSFKSQVLQGVHDFRPSGGNTFKIALYTNAATLNSSTTAYSDTGEVVGGGYTAGGFTLTTVMPFTMGTTGIVTFENVTWTPASFSATGALIYNSTPVHTYTNPSVMVLSFGNERSAQSDQFPITWPAADANNAIIRIA